MSNENSINVEHPEYRAHKLMWRQYRDLYAGGQQLRSRAGEYLARRHREPAEVYSERLSRVFYENYIGSIIDWYAATLMRRDPVIVLDGDDSGAKTFYGLLADDCDLRGTNLAEFFRQRFVETLVCGGSYVVVDFPRIGASARNRAEEDESGRSRAYLTSYGPDEVINWNYDPAGGLEWIVIRTSCVQQAAPSSEWATETRWIHYDRESFRLYRQSGESPIQLIDQGRHAFASLNRPPVFRMKVTDGMWLMNKSALLQLEHFNKSNALSWALAMGLFATPVIYSDREWSQMLGESYYIQLGPDDRFGWTEPEGKVYQIAADNLDKLKDEIYRVCYLMTQAGGSGESRASALSKQMDFKTTEEVLRAFGSGVKDTLRQVLRSIAEARADGIAIDVAGLDEFDIQDFGAELDDAKKLLDLGICSPTLAKQVYKRLASKYLNDARQDLKNQVIAEIDRMSWGQNT